MVERIEASELEAYIAGVARWVRILSYQAGEAGARDLALAAGDADDALMILRDVLARQGRDVQFIRETASRQG